jgi:ABC-type multidrug transport system permease subunit
MASLLGASVIIFFLLFAGFLIIRTRVVGPWKWGIYVSPIHYAYDALTLNEFHEQPFRCTPSQLVPPTSVPNFDAPFPAGFSGQQV